MTMFTQELKEAVELPLTQADKFIKVGITPPKGKTASTPLICSHGELTALGCGYGHWNATGVLMHGPPGTGKTMLARACAKNTDAIFLKLAGPQLVQMYIGDGAKVRDFW